MNRTPRDLIEELVIRCLDAEDREREFDRIGREQPQLVDRVRRVVERLDEHLDERLDKATSRVVDEHGLLDLGAVDDAPPAATRPLHTAADQAVSPSSTAERLTRLEARAPLGLDRYRMEGEIARGGMGAILRVCDEDLGRPLAMKVVLGQDDTTGSSDTSTVNPALLERFLDEAQITGQLHHPGIVPVHELGLDRRGRAYFTMQLVNGRTLDELFRTAHDRGDRSRARVLETFLKICDTLTYAHAKGVLHRDLKPANVMVGEFGEVYVMDWGLAKVTGQVDRHDLRIRPAGNSDTSAIRTGRTSEVESNPESPLVTMDGSVLGTPSYMPPEQAAGRVEELGPRADIYALGAMLYQFLTGSPPYAGPGGGVDAYTILQRVIDGPPTPVRELAPQTPVELAEICERAMARAPKSRYRSMRALADDLRDFLDPDRRTSPGHAMQIRVVALVFGLVLTVSGVLLIIRSITAPERGDFVFMLWQDRELLSGGFVAFGAGSLYLTIAARVSRAPRTAAVVGAALTALLSITAMAFWGQEALFALLRGESVDSHVLSRMIPAALVLLGIPLFLRDLRRPRRR